MNDFIITAHAQQRIDERFIWSKAKLQKLIKKAYVSKLPISKKHFTRKTKLTQVRNFLGYIWIFENNRLITILKI